MGLRPQPPNPGEAESRPALIVRDGDGRLTRRLDGPETPPQTRRQLHPLPPGLVELYGLLAVLFVLVPEWMAGGALLGLQGRRRDSSLPAPSRAWQRLPELRLATMNLAELRLLARELRLWGYAGQSRDRLNGRLLRRLQRQQSPQRPDGLGPKAL